MFSLWKRTSCFMVLVVPVANHTIAVAGSSLPKVCGKIGHYCGKIGVADPQKCKNVKFRNVKMKCNMKNMKK